MHPSGLASERQQARGSCWQEQQRGAAARPPDRTDTTKGSRQVMRERKADGPGVPKRHYYPNNTTAAAAPAGWWLLVVFLAVRTAVAGVRGPTNRCEVPKFCSTAHASPPQLGVRFWVSFSSYSYVCSPCICQPVAPGCQLKEKATDSNDCTLVNAPLHTNLTAGVGTDSHVRR
jgi:hypothetical protein